jgi:hypothetical protein
MTKELEPAFGSSPGRPGQYVLYLSRCHADDPDGNQMAAHIFAAPYSARRFIEVLLEDDGFVWEGATILRSESGIVIKCDLLAKIIGHEYTLAEMAWRLPEPHRGYAKFFRYGRQPTSLTEAQEGRPERKASVPRASRSGMVPIADIAMKLGLKARDARAAFRKAKIPKPAAGWAFKPDEVDGVLEKLRAVMKK